MNELTCIYPGLENSIAAFRASHKNSSPFWSRGSRKLLILIPLNANISHKLEDGDSNIRFYDNLPNNEIDRAGVRGRVYKHSVYRVQDEQGRVSEMNDTKHILLQTINSTNQIMFKYWTSTQIQSQNIPSLLNEELAIYMLGATPAEVLWNQLQHSKNTRKNKS